MERFDEYGFPAVYPPELLSEMRSQLRISEEEFRRLHLCFDAANNLYASISLRELYGLCSRYLPSISREDYLEAAEVISHESRHHYAILRREIYHRDTPSDDPIDQELVAEHLYGFDDEHYFTLVEQQQGKPLYAPDWAEFSKYADNFYIESTSQGQDLVRYLQRTQRKLRCPPAEIVEEFSSLLRSDYDYQYIIDEGQRLGLRFQNQQDFQDFLTLLLKLSHHSRRYIHRGHTPAELELPAPSLEDVRKDVSYDNHYIDPLDKIGHMLRGKCHAPSTDSGKPARNAPCPCGSGRKYKNCCGK